MKSSNYYTKNIATIIEAHKATGETITLQLTCGRAKTNVLNINIDCVYALRELVNYLLAKFRRDTLF